MLGRIQDELQSIYGLEVPHRVEDFLLDEGTYRMLRPSARVPEELLVLEQAGEDEAFVALWLDREVLGALDEVNLDDPRPAPWLPGHAAFATALEGVSHFLYLAHHGERDRPVSLLELEIQAEVDKFVCGLLHLWRRGAKAASRALRRWLFEDVDYRDDLDGEARERYRAANALAGAYCRRLEQRYLQDGSPEGLLREVRAFYRAAAAEKLSLRTLH